MKGQSSHISIIFIMAAIVIASLSLFSLQKTSEIQKTVSEIEFNEFISNMQFIFKEYSKLKKGSSELFITKIPKGIKKICFVDKKSKINEYYSPEFNLQYRLEKDKNVFFYPTNIPAIKLERFSLELNENPLCLEIKKNKLKIKLESTGSSTKLIPLNNYSSSGQCVPLVDINKNKSLDLVFIGNKYNSNNELTEDILKYYNNVFKKIEPFKSNIDKINIFQSNIPLKDCKLQGRIICKDKEIKNAASKCPNDYIFILTKRTKSQDLIFPIRSSSYDNVAKINTADDELVIIHEFGHAFGNLYDEYVDNSYSNFINSVNELPNCDKKNCPSWQNEVGAGCFKGCSLSNFYRATKNSIMNNYRKKDGKKFGPINTKILLKKLEVYK